MRNLVQPLFNEIKSKGTGEAFVEALRGDVVSSPKTFGVAGYLRPQEAATPWGQLWSPCGISCFLLPREGRAATPVPSGRRHVVPRPPFSSCPSRMGSPPTPPTPPSHTVT